MYKNIHIIINPAAGQEEPILTYLNTSLNTKGINWETYITKKSGDAHQFAQIALQQNADVVVVYGGDGTVMEVAQAIINQPTPLGILPGGTANVLAKELGIPTNTVEAIKLLTETSSIKKIDMGSCNNMPFSIRVSMGFLAEMVTQTDRESKDKLGTIAYGISALRSIANSDPTQYTFKIDEREITETGYAMVIANSGNVGIPNISFLPDIDVADGLLDVIVVKERDLGSIVGAVTKTLLQTKPEIFSYWQGKKFTMNTPKDQEVLLDDKKYTSPFLDIKILPQAISVIIPSYV